jgi:hypothetical protein
MLLLPPLGRQGHFTTTHLRPQNNKSIARVALAYLAIHLNTLSF